jgi:hypothetical protein
MPNYGYDHVLVPAGTVVTATGSGVGLEIVNRNDFRGQSIVTVATGTTPSLTVSIDTSYDNGVTDPWRSVGAFTAQTAAAANPAHKSFPGLDRWVRASWVVSGTTPSVTFGVLGEIV